MNYNRRGVILHNTQYPSYLHTKFVQFCLHLLHHVKQSNKHLIGTPSRIFHKLTVFLDDWIVTLINISETKIVTFCLTLILEQKTQKLPELHNVSPGRSQIN